MTYDADYTLRDINPYGDKTANCGVWLQGLIIPYGNISHYQRMLRI